MTVKQLIDKLSELPENEEVVVSIESPTMWAVGDDLTVNEFSRPAILREPDGAVIIHGYFKEGELFEKPIK